MYRLPPIDGEWIDRTKVLGFTFEGRRLEGFSGDTITSALAANGVMTVGRSFKYHRRRGIYTYANHDVNAVFQIGDVPNVRGDVTALTDNAVVSAVNTIGGLANDRGRFIERLARFLPVGFYYKAFHSQRLFPTWERLFRRVSGLGVVDFSSQRQSTPKRYAFCDVLVIGAGPSGLSAALAAADAGARVMLVDENSCAGGSGVWNLMGDRERLAVTQELIVKAHQHPNVEVILDAYAAGYYADHWVAVIEPQRMSKVRAKAVVLATGAIDLPAVFRNNDVPGVMMATAAQRLLYRHAIAAGRNVAVLTSNDDGYAAAIDLLAHNVRVTRLIDTRVAAKEPPLSERLARRGITIHRGYNVTSASSDRSGAIARAVMRPISSTVVDGSNQVEFECDCLLMSAGATPALQLLLQAGGRVQFDERTQQHVPLECPAGTFVAGRANGIYGLDAKLLDGAHAGRSAAAYVRGEEADSFAPAREQRYAPPPIAAHAGGKDFIDLDEDLQVNDLLNAAQEGFDSIELLKRYSTVGMGPSQGKHSNINAARVLAQHRGESLNQIGLTTARPMYHPVPLKHLAGRGFTPERRTPIEHFHERLGAKWMQAGQWRRPEYYMRASQSREESIASEVTHVRAGVGLIDVGTLGKIEIYGPEAGVFLDRAYAGQFSTMKVGTTRYALMLDEAGTIVDDGVVARLAQNAFYFTTTTGNAPTLYRELLRLNALWGSDCALVNVTGHRAAFNLAGPQSRAVLSAITDIDLSPQAFPYLQVREGTVGEAPARVLRVGFVGELGYEIHVPFSYAAHVWQRLFDAGRAYDLQPFGVEAQRVLRLEKGHFIVGHDTDGLTNPFEARADWAIKMEKPFFVGQRSLRILQARGPRQLLCGLCVEDERAHVKECHLIIEKGSIAGRVTSVARSQACNGTIALAMLAPHLAQSGQQLRIRLTDGTYVSAYVVPTPFYDAKNARQALSEAVAA